MMRGAAGIITSLVAAAFIWSPPASAQQGVASSLKITMPEKLIPALVAGSTSSAYLPNAVRRSAVPRNIFCVTAPA